MNPKLEEAHRIGASDPHISIPHIIESGGVFSYLEPSMCIYSGFGVLGHGSMNNSHRFGSCAFDSLIP